MRQMTGEIGKLVWDGKQVGGFRNWTAIVELTLPVHSKVIASGFWMLKKIDTNKVVASFYYEENGELTLICDKEAIIHLPEDYPLDKLVLTPVEMTFEKDFDWRDG